MSITDPPLLDHPVVAAISAVRAELRPLVDPEATQLWRLTDAEMLAAYTQVQATTAMQEALRFSMLAELERRQVCEHEFGLDTAGWLRATGAQSARTAKRDVAVATALATRFVQTTTVLAEGTMSSEQASAIAGVLDELPPDLTKDQLDAAETTMIGYAATYDPRGLTRLAHHLLDVVAPEIAEVSEAERLEREEAEARRTRYLRWGHDGHGSLYLWGKLPIIDGEALRSVVDAIAAHDQHGVDVGPHEGDRTPIEQRRADALSSMTSSYNADAEAPSHGGDRPRVTVLLDYHSLLDGVRTAALIDSGETISASEARHLACDADILPVVLGGPSQPLDVGREQRLFTGGVRHALHVRDNGCVFPGCDRPPRACEAHHIIPWWNGGRTSIDNGVLLCPHHHRLIEPDLSVPEHEQWHMRIGRDGYPDTIPPAHHDPLRRPIRHVRHPERT